MIQVKLVDDRLHEGQTLPRVKNMGNTSMKVLLEYMTKGTAYSPADYESMLKTFSDAVEFFVGMGSSVETPLGRFRPKLKRDPGAKGTSKLSKKSIGINYLPSKGLVERIQKRVKLKVDTFQGPRTPTISGLRSLDGADEPKKGGKNTYADENVTLVPREIIELKGGFLSFTRDNPEEGVFLYRLGADGRETGVFTRINLYIRNGSAYVVFVVPELEPGEYILKVKVQPKNCRVRESRDGIVVRLGEG